MQTMSFYSLKFSSIGMLVFPLGHFECQYVHHLELLPLLFLGAPFASYALRYVLSSKANDRLFVYCCLGSFSILS
ncbi:hypothetical protein CLU79DRAFT_741714 [Phycomyces nitens]|nr:hypothetical protein CLU79DRAFT_741714 [Phycomyces nitens]